MGAYLSKPETSKETSSNRNEYISYGCSSMQGWRRFQEDAHNCILDFDSKKTASLFAVYDGHGGAEVAKYCSLHLPNFILSQESFSTDSDAINIMRILKKSFIDFDKSLTQPKVKIQLKEIASPGPDAVSNDSSPNNSAASDNGSEYDEGEAETTGNGEAQTTSSTTTTKKRSKKSSGRSVRVLLSDEHLEEVAELHEEANRPIEVVLKNQFEGEIPSFIQNLLSSLKGKPGDAGPSTSISASSPEPAAAAASSSSTAVTTAEDAGDDSTTPTEGAASSTSAAAVDVPDDPATSGDVEPSSDGENTEKDSCAASAGSTVVEDAEEGEDDDDEDEDFNVDEVDDEDEEDADSDDDGGGGGDEAGAFFGDSDDTEEEDDDDDDDDDDDEDEEEEEGTSAIGVLPRPVGFSEPGVDSGSTACVALLLPEVVGNDEKRVFLYVANAGDSRAVLCRAGVALELSEDHKPEDEPERTRIEKAGGTVTPDGRVNDGLNLSRAIGDHVYKCRTDLPMADQMISPLPDVTRTELALDGTDEFLVIACDGIWNAKTSQQVIDFVRSRLSPTNNSNGSDLDRSSPAFLASICEELFDACLASDTMGDGTGCDNMTCILLRFDNLADLAQKAVVSSVATEDTVADLEPMEVVDNNVEEAEPGVEEAEVSRDQEENHPPSPSATAVTNGDDENVSSPVLKKARMESPQTNSGNSNNGDSCTAVAAVVSEDC